MKTKLFFVLCSLIFVCSCGNGDGTPGPNPCVCPDKADCPCPDPDGGNGQTDGQIPLTCDNGTCDQGENCGNCRVDCPCQEGEECQEGKCEVKGYVCPEPDNPPAICAPKEYREAYCGEFSHKCVRGRATEIPCLTDAECQAVPPDQWPPCVCWQFCGYAGKWDCEDTDFSITVTIDNSPDGTYCDLNINNGAWHLFGLPDDPPPRAPKTGEPVEKLELTENGLDFKTSYLLYHCTVLE